MKTLSIALTCVFVTLKLTGNVDWPWFWVVSPIVFWCALALLFGVAALWVKAAKRVEEEEREETRSKWQQRLDQMKEAREKLQGNKTTVIVILLMCATIYSCRPAHKVTACPKPFYGKFNK
jgi:Na+/melibiose symporter-like transporter